jgi:voltage-gated potassium channel Kch
MTTIAGPRRMICGVRLKALRSWRWWPVTMATLRAVLTASVIVALYYLLPLDLRDSHLSTFGKLALGIAILVGLMTWHIRTITQSESPALRALEGLAVAVPLFILLFASAYYLMSRADESSFTSPLSRTDGLYFAVTIFSTVGFGDISARTESARLVVSAQMILDLLLLGLGVRIIVTAVQRGRDRLASKTSADPGSQ